MRTHPVNAAKAEMTLLLVDDDHVNRSMALHRLEDRYQRVLVAADGAEGLQLFNEYAPDIVLSDHVMPRLSGMELSRMIRNTDQETPILLMTSDFSDTTLLDAISIGVNRFIPKPFDFTLLLRLLDELTQELTDKRDHDRRKSQELALMRDRASYNWTQQQTARRKERHVVRHDLRNEPIVGAGGHLWGLTAVRTPRDIMCGDAFSVRKLLDGRLMIFVMDAMGSGLSASLSALLATSFCNYQVDHLHQWQQFSLLLFLARFQEYLGGMLLEEEVISCAFLLADPVREQVDYAVFGLPPILVRELDGSVHKVVSNNAPLSVFSEETVVGTLSLAKVADLMIVTDGVTDALLANGGTYRELIEEDYRLAPTLARMQRLFSAHTLNEELDDYTLLHFERLDLPPRWRWDCRPEAHPDSLHAATVELLRELSAVVPLSDELRSDLGRALTAALFNALEHGCLAIDPGEKALLQEEGRYQAYLSALPRPEGCIRLSASLWCGSGLPLLVLQVLDPGPGPGAKMVIDACEGSGLGEIVALCDAVFAAEEKGLFLLKTIDVRGDYGTCM